MDSATLLPGILLALAGIATAVAEALRPRVVGVRDLAAATGLDVTGGVSRASLPRRPDLRRDAAHGPPADLAGAARALDERAFASGGAVVTVVSAGSRRGAPALAYGLARALAGLGRATVLVSADLRGQGIERVCRLEDGEGLAELLDGHRLDPTGRFVELGPGLLLLPAGRSGGDPPELLERDELPRLLALLRAAGHAVIVDAPPRGRARELAALTRATDAVLLAVRAGSRWSHVQETASRLVRASRPKAVLTILVGGLLRDPR